MSQTKKSLNFGSSHQSCSIGKAVLKNFINIHRKTTVLEALFNRVAGLRACDFIKRDSGPVILLKETETQQHRCFPVNIAKFSRTPILKKIFEQLPVEFLRLTVNISSQGLVSTLDSIAPLQGPLQCLKSSLEGAQWQVLFLFEKREISQNSYSLSLDVSLVYLFIKRSIESALIEFKVYWKRDFSRNSHYKETKPVILLVLQMI